MFDTTDLTQPKTIADRVRDYRTAMDAITEAYQKLSDAQRLLDSTFLSPAYGSDFAVIPDRYASKPMDVLKAVKESIKRKAWTNLYHALDIKRVLSIKRAEEIEQRLHNGELPEITEQAVYELFETMTQNINQFAEESIREVYEWLRPRADSYRMERYKTNQKNARFEIGKKVILTGIIDTLYVGGQYRVSYYMEKHLIALDRVFHILDGKQMLNKSYRSPLVDAINTAQGSTAETDYFSCRMYQNRNLHLDFKRDDLLRVFNAVAGGANLKDGT